MSKIPEGATHTAPDKTYRKMAGKHWLTYADGDWIFVEGAAPQHYTPIQAEPEWSGEGLPPVDLLVEWLECNQTGWQRVKVLAYANGEAWIQSNLKQSVVVYNPANFRPIRTPEQIEAKERNRVCDRIFGIITGPGVERKDNRSDMAEALYDAGLRFVEVTK